MLATNMLLKIGKKRKYGNAKTQIPSKCVNAFDYYKKWMGKESTKGKK